MDKCVTCDVRSSFLCFLFHPLPFTGSSTNFDVVHEEEVTIVGGALKFREMTVDQVMTPVEDVYMISVTEKLSYKVRYCLWLLSIAYFGLCTVIRIPMCICVVWPNGDGICYST